MAFIENLKKGYAEGLRIAKVSDDIYSATGFYGQELIKEVSVRGEDLTKLHVRPTVKPGEIGNIVGGLVSSLRHK